MKKHKVVESWDGPIGAHLRADENPPTRITLTERGYRDFLKILKKPTKPTAALRRLMAGGRFNGELD